MSKVAGSSWQTGRHFYRNQDGAVHTMKRLIAEPEGSTQQNMEEEPSLHKRQRNVCPQFPGARSGSPLLIKDNTPAVVCSHDKPHTMTFFYGGSVLVYDHVPPPKAHAIMHLARSADKIISDNDSGLHHGYQSHTSAHDLLMPNKVAPPSLPSNMFPKSNEDGLLIQCSHIELPLARKISLTRFFQKRKEMSYKIQAKAIMREYDDEA
eukprot:c33704_g1_i1 orf=113-736(+)